MNSHPGEQRAPASVLSLVWRVRNGPDKTRREFLDFEVDGKSLRDMFDVDHVGWFADWGDWPKHRSIDELLPEGSPSLRSVIEGVERRLLYVCAECGDQECGAETVVITEEGGRIIWRDFAQLWWEPRDYQPVFDTEPYTEIGPFSFDREQYVDTLTNLPPHP